MSFRLMNVASLIGCVVLLALCSCSSPSIGPESEELGGVRARYFRLLNYFDPELPIQERDRLSAELNRRAASWRVPVDFERLSAQRREEAALALIYSGLFEMNTISGVFEQHASTLREPSTRQSLLRKAEAMLADFELAAKYLPSYRRIEGWIHGARLNIAGIKYWPSLEHARQLALQTEPRVPSIYLFSALVVTRDDPSDADSIAKLADLSDAMFEGRLQDACSGTGSCSLGFRVPYSRQAWLTAFGDLYVRRGEGLLARGDRRKAESYLAKGEGFYRKLLEAPDRESTEQWPYFGDLKSRIQYVGLLKERRSAAAETVSKNSLNRIPGFSRAYSCYSCHAPGN